MKVKMYGMFVTGFLREQYAKGDFVAIAETVPDMTVKDALAVCKGEADLVGDNESGFEVQYSDNIEEERHG